MPVSHICWLLVALALVGCGQSGPQVGGEGPENQLGPSIEDLTNCDHVRAVYDDAMQDVRSASDRDDRSVAKLVARRAVERMRELECADVPKPPK